MQCGCDLRWFVQENRPDSDIKDRAPNEQTKSVVPHLRRSTACLWTQPFRAGLFFGAGPLGLDCKHRFPMFIPPLT
jgi:hypothetical protein